MSFCRIFLLHILFIAASSFPLLAKELIGTAIVDGKIIQIFNDNTWKYKGNNDISSTGDCDFIKLNFYFCNSENFKTTTPVDPISKMYEIDGRTFVGFIVEPMGTVDGVTGEAMANVALQFAAEGAGVSASEIPQYFIKNETINGYDYTSMAYSAKLTSGIDFTFLNNIFVQENITVQAVVYTLGQEVTDDLLKYGATVVKSVDFR